MLWNSTSSPISMPNLLTSPALISNVYAAGDEDLKFASSELGVSGGECCTSSIKSTTVQFAPIHTKSSGKRMPFIQKADVWPLGKMKSMPVCSAKLSRSPSPLLRSSEVSAISAENVVSPISTVGPVGVAVGEGEGMAVAVGTDVDVGVGRGAAVGFGARVAVGTGISVGTGVTVAVGKDGGVDSGRVTVAAMGVATAGETLIRSSSPVQAIPLTISVAKRIATNRVIKMLCQMHQSRAVAAALAGFRLERARERMAGEVFAHGVAQDAFAPAVYDAH